MKKFKYIKGLIIILSVFFTGACSVDDDLPIISKTKTSITAQTESKIVRIPATDNSYSAVINFSNPVTSFGRLSYTLDGNEMSIDVSQGTSQVEIPVDMSDSTLFVRTLTLTDFKIINAELDEVAPGISKELHTIQIVKGENTVVFTFTWNDDSDLDCGTIIRTPSVAAVNISDGTANVEVAVLPDNAADGEYFFAILPWTVNSNPIECYVEVINGTEVSNFTGNLVDAQPAGFFGYNTIEDFIKIVKTTDPVTGTVSITLEQVLF